MKRQYPLESAGRLTLRLNAGGGPQVSVDTTRRALHDLGYSWRAPNRKRLTPAQKRNRVAFARERLHDKWDTVWAFDEAYFNLYRSKNKVWLKVSTDELAAYPKLSTRQEKISVGIAAAISHTKKSPLIFLSRGWNADELREKFSETIYPALHWSDHRRNGNRLIIDNDGRHQSTAWTDYKAETHLHCVEPWPANSPDLNPIENVWAWMKTEVEKALASTEAELKDAIVDAWSRYPLEFTGHLMDSMPARLRATIKNNGGRVRY
jgi:transposase